MRRNKKRQMVLQILFFPLLILSHAASPASLFEEGAEQDRVEQKRSSWAFLPVFYYTPETKIAFGASSVYFFRRKESEITRPSAIMPVFIYTQNKQIISQLMTNLYWKDETYHLAGGISYIKFPSRFYGIGNNTSFSLEEDYTPRFARLLMNFQKKVRKGLNLGIRYELEDRELIEVEESGRLARGDILGSEGGTASGAGILVNWDTRNNLFYPSEGSFYQFSASLFSSAFFSDYDFTRYNLDFRQYFPLFSSHVLAFQGYLNIMTGHPPFQMLSLFGGPNVMRGYYRGRYRDKNMIAFQMEYRIPVWWRLGLVGFVGFGDVADKVSHFELLNFKYSVGWGVRYLLLSQERINVRLDFGIGGGSSNLYITINEAF